MVLSVAQQHLRNAFSKLSNKRPQIEQFKCSETRLKKRTLEDSGKKSSAIRPDVLTVECLLLRRIFKLEVLFLGPVQLHIFQKLPNYP